MLYVVVIECCYSIYITSITKLSVNTGTTTIYENYRQNVQESALNDWL